MTTCLSAAAGLALVACGQGEQAAGEREAETDDRAEAIEIDTANLTVSDTNCQVLTRWPQGETGDIASPVSNEIAMAADNYLSFNGEPTPRDGVAQYLEIVATMQPVPPVIFVLDGSENCDEARGVSEMIEDIVECNPGVCTAVIRDPDDGGTVG
ncbi:hypothetical protein [Parasphingopyxis sp.]|uniref:hypothetical protein n=1 Tax=Parasphingopyxis sp. TaxID=1920299 RepID=UPI003FA07153